MNKTQLLRKLRPFLDANFQLRSKCLKVLYPYFKGDLLEIGAGYLPDINFLMTTKINSYTACDREEFSDKYAKIKSDKCIYYKGEVLPFKKDKFKTILSLDCLEHILPHEIDKYISEVYRVLEKKGNFIISAPFFYPEHESPYDYLRFTKNGLRIILENKRFNIIKILPRGSTVETLLCIINQRLVMKLFPSNLNSFTGNEGDKNSQAILKKIIFPLTLSLFTLNIILINILGVLPRWGGGRKKV
jgi:SAM-dependent methyltransferase